VKSGFVTFVGRPNVGKSTLVNRILSRKVSIVSDKPQTTRTQVRGVLTRRDPANPAEITSQLVFVDTPGIHKPRSALGSRLNASAREALSGVDVVCFVVDATAPIGRGDEFVASSLQKNAICVLNKCDIAERSQIAAQLTKASGWEFSEYFPVSARTGKGVFELVDRLIELMPEGPAYYPDNAVTDVPEAFWVAELVREQLLAITRDELPHSIATRVVEWSWPRIRCEILVEHDSQKGIVIGHGGAVLKAVGTKVREQLEPGAFLELHVKVEKNWQRRPQAIERLGYGSAPSAGDVSADNEVGIEA
jgi:GTP-binding protein Era